jgi:hypothetical protein
MVKKQQMRWSQQGAHRMLQVRTRVLNDELREIFQQWYPRLVQLEIPIMERTQDVNRTSWFIFAAKMSRKICLQAVVI